ncbi:MAG: YciI family protein [Chloroflexi bacterium]|nr:YciI family protein [Chloroflexota bacterium]
MRYMLLIHYDETQMANRLADEQAKVFQAYQDFTMELQEAGVMLAGDALHPTTTAKTARIVNGNPMTTDGPFAETKEQLGGFYMIDVSTEAEALRWALKIPDAAGGSIEVRPVLELNYPRVDGWTPPSNAPGGKIPAR